MGALHMIGNAHLDPVWLWQWQEGFQAAKATFRSALDRMGECDDFLFTSSSAAVYEWIEQNDREMFEEIRRRVAEGRWEIVGGWWIQPDCNLPSGESFVRQALYGQRYFAEKLGVTATVGYNVDSFGHAASLPQILLKSGLSAYVFTRPQPHEQRLPSRLFWWESEDGSRVLAYRIPYEYCTWGGELCQHVLRCAAELKGSLDKGSLPPQGGLMCFYGVGNHGGGPTRENLASIRDLNGDPSLPALVFSTPSRYFQSVADKAPTLPVVQDELQHHAVGCYSAHSHVKRWNRRAENLLLTAEKFSSLAARIAGQPYPTDFDRAWKDVLFNQFHDILAGTSIEPAYDDARNLYGEAMAIAGRHLNNAIQSISWKIDIEQEEGVRPIVVFNPHSFPICAPVELEIGRLGENDPPCGGQAPILLDADGSSIPFQPVRSLATVSSGSRNRLAFLADLPAFGYHTYRLSPGNLHNRSDDASTSSSTTDVGRTSSAGQTESRDPLRTASDLSLENTHFRLEINPQTGCLTSLFDKREQFEWLRHSVGSGSREAAKPLVLDDPSDTWSHGVLRYDRVVGEFTPRSIKLVEHGPVKAVIRVESEYGRSRLTQDFTMYAELDQIDVKVTVDWHEQFKVLKLNFPVNLYYSSATYEVPYGFFERPANGEEEPGQSWVDLMGVARNNGKLLGLSILNDGKYSFDMKEHEINLTVLRSPIYAHHTPYEPQPDEHYTFIDQGVQRFTYSLVPHAGRWADAGIVQRALLLNQPPIALLESCHPGPFPQRDANLWVNWDNVVVTTIKRAEVGDDLIVRCYETAGRAATATIHLPKWNRVIEARFTPGEIKTFRVPADEHLAVREVSLIEWEPLASTAGHGGPAYREEESLTYSSSVQT